jgi:hypothetical protein
MNHEYHHVVLVRVSHEGRFGNLRLGNARGECFDVNVHHFSGRQSQRVNPARPACIVLRNQPLLRFWKRFLPSTAHQVANRRLFYFALHK